MTKLFSPPHCSGETHFPLHHYIRWFIGFNVSHSLLNVISVMLEKYEVLNWHPWYQGIDRPCRGQREILNLETFDSKENECFEICRKKLFYISVWVTDFAKWGGKLPGIFEPSVKIRKKQRSSLSLYDFS